MRCAKCGYVTFDAKGECPKCGKGLPEPLVATALLPPRSGAKRAVSFLSSLTMSPVPRYFGPEGDPEVVSLLDSPPSAARAPAPVAEEAAPKAPRPAAIAPAGPEEATEPSMGDLLAGAGETPPPEEPQEEKAEEAVPAAGDGEGEDLLASLGLEELDVAAAPPEGVESEAVESAGEEVAAPSVAEGAPAGAEEEDLAALLDEADQAGGEAPAAEESAAAAEAPSLAGGEEDLDSLWDEALSEPGAAPAGEAAPEEPATAPAASSGGEGVDSLWEEAFADSEGGGAEAPAAAESPEGAPAGDDISGMWDDALAEQEAAIQAHREGAEPEAAAATAGGGEEDVGELEQMWASALSEAGEAAPAEAEAPPEPAEPSAPAAEEPSGEDDEDLDALFAAAEGGAPEGGAEDAAVVEEPAEPASEGEAEPEAPAGGGVDPFGGGDDLDEIDAFVPEEGPAEETPPAGDVEGGFFDEGSPPEPEEVVDEELAAALSHRVIAGVVDFFLVGVLGGIFALVTHLIVEQAAGPIFSNMEALVLVLALDAVVVFLLSFFYSVYFIGVHGFTPGHRLVGLGVVDMGDRRVGYMQAVLRYFGGLAATLPLGLGHLLVVFDKRRRGIGDRLAGTRVGLLLSDPAAV